MNRAHTRSTYVFTLLLLTGLTATASLARAGQLSDPAAVLPADTITYIGWPGADDVKAARDATAYGKLMNEPEVRRFRDALFTTADHFLRMAAAEEDATASYEAAAEIVDTLVHQPMVVAVLDAGMNQQTGFVFEAALICEEKEPGVLLGHVRSLLETAGLPDLMPFTVRDHSFYQLPLPLPVPIFLGQADNLFMVTLGNTTAEKVLSELDKPAGSLRNAEVLKTCRAKIGGDDRTRCLSIFVNLDRVWPATEQLLAVFAPDPGAAAKLNGMLSLMGYRNFKAYCSEMHYRDGGLYRGEYVYGTEKHAGMMAALSTTALTDADLRCIPKDAAWALAFNIEPGKLFNAVREFVATTEPNAGPEFDHALSQAEAEIGMSIRDDLLGPLGDTIVVFDAPSNAGFLFSGTTLVLELKNPEQFTAQLTKLAEILGRETSEDDFQLELKRTQCQGHDVTFLNFKGLPIPVAPAWAIHDHRMVIALFPQTVVAAVRRLEGADNQNTLLSHEPFIKARKAVGDLGSTLFYVDSYRGVEQLYALLLPAAQAGAAMAQGYGVDVDVTVVPSRDVLTRHVLPYLETVHNTDTSLLQCAHSSLPLPIPTISESGGLQLPMLVSVMLPSLSRARHLSMRLVSAQNLKGIGVSCHIYAMDNNGDLPPDLETLVGKEYGVAPEQLIAPADNSDAPSYVYLGAGHKLDSLPNHVFLAYERLAINNNEGANVLFPDGHVIFLHRAEFERGLTETRAYLAEKP